jgi:serine/threonine-protein kinase RsbW
MSEHPAAYADTVVFHTAGDLAAVRAFVRARSLELGLPVHRADLLTLAVSELATNTLQHTSGGGRVGVRAESGRLVCELVDGGPVRMFNRAMPQSDSVRGRGLAIVNRVCDDVTAYTVPDGTLVRMRMRL